MASGEQAQVFDPVDIFYHTFEAIPTFLLINLRDYPLLDYSFARPQDDDELEINNISRQQVLKDKIEILGGRIVLERRAPELQNSLIPLLVVTSDEKYNLRAFQSWKDKCAESGQRYDAFHENFIHDIFINQRVGDIKKYIIGPSIFEPYYGEDILSSCDWYSLKLLEIKTEVVSPEIFTEDPVDDEDEEQAVTEDPVDDEDHEASEVPTDDEEQVVTEDPNDDEEQVVTEDPDDDEEQLVSEDPDDDEEQPVTEDQFDDEEHVEHATPNGRHTGVIDTSNRDKSKKGRWFSLDSSTTSDPSESESESEASVAEKADEVAGSVDSSGDETIFEKSPSPVASRSRSKYLSTQQAAKKESLPSTSRPRHNNETSGSDFKLSSSSPSEESESDTLSRNKRKGGQIRYQPVVKYPRRRGFPLGHSRLPSIDLREQKILLKYVIDNNEYGRIKGRDLFKEMVAAKILPGRTYQTLQNHMRKILLKRSKFVEVAEYMDMDFTTRANFRSYLISD